MKKVSNPKVIRVERIPAIADTSPSGEYVTIQHLLADARVRSWSDAKVGRKMLQHFGNLLEQGKKAQHSECDICDGQLVDAYDVAQYQGRIVHRTCRTLPNGLAKAIGKSLKAYQE